MTTARPATKGRTNGIVTAVLTSPLHRLLSRWLCVVEYTGRRTERRFATPTQYVHDDDRLLILVGNHATKTWWRNFEEPGHPISAHLKGQTWRGTGLAMLGSDRPDDVAQFLQKYFARYPRTAKLFGAADPHQAAPDACVVVVEFG